MATELYPDISTELTTEKQVESILSWIEEVNRLRENEDISDFDNLTNRFITGRRGFRIPTDPDSVLSTDEVGDIVNDSLYIYELVEETTGTNRWSRRALDFSW